MTLLMARDVEHFQRFTRLLEMERQAERSRLAQEKQTLPLAELEARGLVVLDVETTEESLGLGGRYLITFMHESRRRLSTKLGPGDLLTVSAPRNNFPLADDAKRHVLVAGGIGVTPMMAMVETLAARGADFKVLYCSRSPDLTAFRDRLKPHAEAGRVTIHHDEGDPLRGLDVAAALREHEEDTHLYCCGPGGLMNAVKAATAHWPAGTVHFEFFSVPVDTPATSSASVERPEGDDRFQIKLAGSGVIFAVPHDKSIVEVLRENGVECETSCEAGICGPCRTRYLEGTPDHRDYVLSDEEHKEFVMICCARSQSKVLVLDR